jgi:predicted amidohydrolase
MPLRIAVFQSPSGGLGFADRLERLGSAMAEAAADGAGLLVCPELYMSGYNIGDAIMARAEAADGPFARAVATLARRHGIAVGYGFPENHKQTIYNAAICISDAGETLAVHRKRVLPPGMESQYFATGAGDTLFDLGGLTVALIICYEAEFPEAVRNTVLAGAHLVVAPTALGEAWPHVAHKVIPTRAFENGVGLVYANHAGEEVGLNYLGASCIVGPDGHDLARAGAGEELIAADISLEAVKAARDRLPYLRDRAAFLSGGAATAD